MSIEENKALLRSVLEEVLNQGKINLIDNIYDENIVAHAFPDEIRGRDGVRKMFTAYRNAFPDIHFTIEELVAEGDIAVARWTARGTHQGDLMGISPTGKKITMTGITMIRVKGGKIVEGWTNRDALGLMQQLGAVPMPVKVGN